MAVSDNHGDYKAMNLILEQKGDIFIHAGTFVFYFQETSLTKEETKISKSSSIFLTSWNSHTKSSLQEIMKTSSRNSSLKQSQKYSFHNLDFKIKDSFVVEKEMHLLGTLANRNRRSQNIRFAFHSLILRKTHQSGLSVQTFHWQTDLGKHPPKYRLADYSWPSLWSVGQR